MEPVAVEEKQSGGTPGIAQALWDPFWFVRAMLGWGRFAEAPSSGAKAPAGAPSLAVKETDGAYVCTVKLALPDQADAARVKAKLDNGELTVVVPKSAAATPEPASSRPRTGQTKGKGRGSAARAPRRGARSRTRRG